jgi:hypothetical protein
MEAQTTLDELIDALDFQLSRAVNYGCTSHFGLPFDARKYDQP